MSMSSSVCKLQQITLENTRIQRRERQMLQGMRYLKFVEIQLSVQSGVFLLQLYDLCAQIDIFISQC